jgi:predicted aconitase with swiveling domain
VKVEARLLTEGVGEGPVLVLSAPLSLWGGVDTATGQIVEAGHPQAGSIVTGKVLLLTHGRGSSSAASVLAEMIRLGTAPAAIILGHPDPIIVSGAVVASELYGEALPVAWVDSDGWHIASRASHAEVRADGQIRLE